MEKLNKKDRALVKSYRVINLINCLGKVVEKFVVEQLSQFGEAKKKFHRKQMGGRKNYSAIDTMALVILKVYKTWEEKQVVNAFLMDVKEAFDHVLQAKLAQQMTNLGINNDFIG